MTDSAFDAPAGTLKALLEEHRDEIERVLARNGASNPRLFGSVARGEDGPDSDVDIIVDVDTGTNPLLAVAGAADELSRLLGVSIDVVTESLLRHGVSEQAAAEAVEL